jgi:hypothetical protein
MAEAGVEHSAKSPGNTQGSAESGAESGALCIRGLSFGPDLASVINAWPSLPDAIRADILAIVRGITHGNPPPDFSK